MRYVLNNPPWRAVADTLGGELISCEKNGVEHVWTGDAAYWTGHAPILFPVVCALKNGRTSFGGMPFSMKQHGFARRLEFTPLRVAEDRISMVLTDSPETREMYPYSFSLTVTHTLTDNGFKTEYEVLNTNASVLPFAIGGHAGFMCPLLPGEAFSDYRIVFEKKENPAAMLLNDDSLLSEGLTRDVLEEDGTVLPAAVLARSESALIFPHLASRRLLFENSKTGKGLVFTFGNFVNLGIWTPPGKDAPFLCLEPWQGLPSYDTDSWIFEEKADVVFLPAGQIFRAEYEMQSRL